MNPSESYQSLGGGLGYAATHCECLTGSLRVTSQCWGPVAWYASRTPLHGAVAVARCKGHAGILYKPEDGR
jgi:hypothetical protein